MNTTFKDAVGTVWRTRFNELGYVHDGPALWRFVDLTWKPTGNICSRVGQHYKSRAELLADLDRYAKEYGCT